MGNKDVDRERVDLIGTEPVAGWEDADWDRYYDRKYKEEFCVKRKAHLDKKAKERAVEDASTDFFFHKVVAWFRRLI